MQKTRAQILELFARQVVAWTGRSPAEAGVIRERVCAALKFSPEEFRAWVGSIGGSRGGSSDEVAAAFDAAAVDDAEAEGNGTAPHPTLSPEGRGDNNSTADSNGNGIHYPGQPGPLGEAPTGDAERTEITNFVWEEREKPNAHGVKEKKNVPIAKNLDVVRGHAWVALKRWPCRVRAPGALMPLLFVDAGKGEVSWINKAKVFTALLQEYGRLKFCKGLDFDKSDFVSTETLYEHFGSSAAVPEFLAVEYYPHEPLIPRHYYAWRPRPGLEYTPDGTYLAELLTFFDNVPDPVSRALLAAAFVTPFWGGPYGKRPAFIYEAFMRGSGKTTVATVLAGLCGEALSINLDKHAEERLKERLLSPEGMIKRVCLIDNVKGVLSNALLEELITSKFISGKKLAVGECSRPNNLTYLITANSCRLSPDMARRSFFIRFVKPEKTVDQRDGWENKLLTFLKEHGEKVVLDAIHVLRMPKPGVSWGGLVDETFSLWASEVLARVMMHPKVYESIVGRAVGDISDLVTPLEVLRKNQALRDEADDDREEAETLLEGLCELVCAWKGYYVDGLSKVEPSEDVFIRTTAPPAKGAAAMTYAEEEEWKRAQGQNMVAYFEKIFAKELNAKTLANILDGHIEAGRIEGLMRGRKRDDDKKQMRGYSLSKDVIIAYLHRNDASHVDHAGQPETSATTTV